MKRVKPLSLLSKELFFFFSERDNAGDGHTPEAKWATFNFELFELLQIRWFPIQPVGLTGEF